MKKILKVGIMYPLTTLCVVAIWVLCFCMPPKTQLDDVPFIDKWAHLLMYGGTTSVFWWEYWRQKSKGKMLSRITLLWVAVLVPILMSGLIEILQATCTGGRRSGDILDFVANSLGVLLGWLLGTTVVRWLSSKIFHA